MKPTDPWNARAVQQIHTKKQLVPGKSLTLSSCPACRRALAVIIHVSMPGKELVIFHHFWRLAFFLRVFH